MFFEWSLDGDLLFNGSSIVFFDTLDTHRFVIHFANYIPHTHTHTMCRIGSKLELLMDYFKLKLSMELKNFINLFNCRFTNSEHVNHKLEYF